MQKVQQTNDTPTRACDRFDWCSGELHAKPHDTVNPDLHARSGLYVDNRVEVAVEVLEPEASAHVWVDTQHTIRPDDWRTQYLENLDASQAREYAAKYRELATALEQAAMDVDTITSALAEVCS